MFNILQYQLEGDIMQEIKYNKNKYNFYNVGEHLFRTKIELDTIEINDGYSVFKCDDNYVYYINNKPVIVDIDTLNCSTNRFGKVFLDLDKNEKLCKIKEHTFILPTRWFYNAGLELARKMTESIDINSLFKNYEIPEYSDKYHYNENKKAIFTNIVPVIINTDDYEKPGISLEDNATLKLKRYL